MLPDSRPSSAAVGCHVLVLCDKTSVLTELRKPHLWQASRNDPLFAAPVSKLDGKNGYDFPAIDVALAEDGDQAATLVESASRRHTPFAVVVIDVGVLPAKLCIHTVHRMWHAQRDLHVIMHNVPDPEVQNLLAVGLGSTPRVLVFQHELKPAEIATLTSSLASTWARNRESGRKEAALNQQILENSKRLEETSERLRREQERRAQLEDRVCKFQRLETVGRLADGMAHDFNNFLTVIQGHLSVALSEPTTNPRLKSSLEAILTEAQKAADMTRHLLAFNHREYMKPKPVRISKAVDRETELLRRTLGEQVAIEVEHEPGLPLAMADPACLSQIILNLAVHARDTMPNGGRITINTRRLHIPNAMAAGLVHTDASPGDYVVISMADTGRGMKADEVARLFEPPDTPPPAGGNSGLGLVLIHGLVRHLGGWINVMSVPEVGTEFAIHLPAAASETAEPAPPAKERGLLEEATPSAPSTILIVDDEDSVRQVMEYVLTSQGHKVLTAKDANEGWALWRSYSHMIKLAILDIMLPGGSSGFDLAQAINEVDRTVPVVFTCGYCPTTIKQHKELEQGVNFLPKPFGMVELLNVVSQALLQPVRL